MIRPNPRRRYSLYLSHPTDTRGCGCLKVELFDETSCYGFSRIESVEPTSGLPGFVGSECVGRSEFPFSVEGRLKDEERTIKTSTNDQTSCDLVLRPLEVSMCLELSFLSRGRCHVYPTDTTVSSPSR